MTDATKIRALTIGATLLQVQCIFYSQTAGEPTWIAITYLIGIVATIYMTVFP